MGRPQNAQPDATKKALLSAAATLFAKKGLNGTTVREIAAKAGVSLGLVRYYFGSKEKLYEECITDTYRIFQSLTTEVTTSLVEGAELEELLERSIRGAFRFAWQHRERVKLVLQDNLNDGSDSVRRTEQLMLPFLRIIGSQLAARSEIEQHEGILALRTITLLISRYSTIEMSEISTLLEGRFGEQSEQETRTLIEDHLVEIFLKLTIGSDRSQTT